ncbi:TipAS antibiotic-recognition domain-containing protein [Dielma fastidiosa]|uniref:TipAS antibiotic-recognition domain-containing protein n=1 Tax=Dielma fastidiosa TaxID=1034346 RepID=A0AB35UPZ2_9FIRM|nr:TipAS antibiotic-recognition domain-containing protein [Dielma fastidiosa]MDY5168827.1 TipAS antibiotic-recognition domain-containing protein [Dielma fastidiosa]
MKNHKKKKVRNKPVNRGIRVSEQTSEEQLEKIGLEAEKIYQMFIDNMSKDLDSPDVYNCVIAWQEYLTKYYYKCTDMILARLANLYVTDKRFTESMDQFQIGLAGFMSQAIKAYLRRDLPKLPKAEKPAPAAKEEKAEEVKAPAKKKAVKKTAADDEAAPKKAAPKKTAAKKTAAKTEVQAEESAEKPKAARKPAAKKTAEKATEKKAPAKKAAAKKTAEK